MWLIPTRNRPQAMRELIASMKQTKDVPVCAVMQDGDEYDLDWPKHWHIHHSRQHLEMQLALNALFDLYPSEASYGVLTDQSRPETPLWSGNMERAAGSNQIAMSNSTKERFNPRTSFRRITAYCMGGDLARALGYVWPRFVVHLYGDDVLEDIGYGLGIMHYLPHIVIRAKQQRDGEVPIDQNHKRLWQGAPYLNHDRIAYERWRKNGHDTLMNRLRKLYTENADNPKRAEVGG